MTWDDFSLATIRHYAAMARSPGARDYVRAQVREMERDPLWGGLEAKVRDHIAGVGKKVEQGAAWLRLAQTGYVQLYALIITLGMVVVFGYLALR